MNEWRREVDSNETTHITSTFKKRELFDLRKTIQWFKVKDVLGMRRGMMVSFDLPPTNHSEEGKEWVQISALIKGRLALLYKYVLRYLHFREFWKFLLVSIPVCRLLSEIERGCWDGLVLLRNDKWVHFVAQVVNCLIPEYNINPSAKERWQIEISYRLNKNGWGGCESHFTGLFLLSRWIGKPCFGFWRRRRIG